MDTVSTCYVPIPHIPCISKMSGIVTNLTVMLIVVKVDHDMVGVGVGVFHFT